MLTIGEVSSRLASATGQDSAQIARSLRNWVQQGIIMPTTREARGTTGTINAALFDRGALVRARILMAVAAVGIGSPLRILDYDLRITVDPTGKHTPSNPALDRIIFDALSSADTRWDLHVAIRRGQHPGLLTGWLENGELDEFAKDKWSEHEDEIEAIVSVPVSRMLSELDLSGFKD